MNLPHFLPARIPEDEAQACAGSTDDARQPIIAAADDLAEAIAEVTDGSQRLDTTVLHQALRLLLEGTDGGESFNDFRCLFAITRPVAPRPTTTDEAAEQAVEAVLSDEFGIALSGDTRREVTARLSAAFSADNGDAVDSGPEVRL